MHVGCVDHTRPNQTIRLTITPLTRRAVFRLPFVQVEWFAGEIPAR